MFCPNCRNQVDENTEFCPHCGTDIKQIQVQLQNLAQNNFQQPIPQNYNQNISQMPINNKKRKKFSIVLLIIVLLLLVVAIFGASKVMKKDATPP